MEFTCTWVVDAEPVADSETGTEAVADAETGTEAVADSETGTEAEADAVAFAKAMVEVEGAQDSAAVEVGKFAEAVCAPEDSC